LVTGTHDAAPYIYPKSLPWLQFLDRDLRVVLEGIEFLPRKMVTGTLTEAEATRELFQIVQQPDVVSLSNSQKSRLLPAVFKQIVRRSLDIAVRSEGMAMQLLAQKSVDRLAAQFDLVLPQAYPDENLRRATTLAGGSVPDIQVELLKILLFLVSNRLILNEQYHGELDDARHLVTLCQLSGLSQLQSLRKLVDLSHRSLTVKAIIDALFKAAVLTGAAGFAYNLLKADCRLKPDKMIMFRVHYEKITMRRLAHDGTPLEYALTKQYETLVKVLVDHGAKLPSYARDDWSLLAVAIYEDFPSTLTQFLRQSGAHINGSGFEAVHAAFITGNLHLVDRLVARGADLNCRYRGSSLDSKAILLNPFATSDYFHVLRHVDDVGCLGFAASFHSATMVTRSKEPADLWESFAEDQEKALELCRAIHSKYRSLMDLSDGRMTADAMILASARGYTKVIAFLYNEFSASVNTPSGHLSPLYAAVGWKQVEAAQLLLKLGACPPAPKTCSVASPYIIYDVFGTVDIECPAPSLLQLAAAQGSYELTELLVHTGVEIDEEREIALDGNKIYWPPVAGPSALDHTNRSDRPCVNTTRLRPFQLAVLSKEWDVGLTLLQYGAVASAADLFDVAVEGGLALVEQLINAGINPAQATKDGITAYEAALYNGHGALAARLAAAKGCGSATDFASVFRIPDVRHIKAHVPRGFLREPRKMCRDREGRSYLENAILSNDEEVIMLALSLDPTAYDSGVLCAEVLSLMKSGQKTASPVLMELLQRRTLGPESNHVNLALENHAVSIAAWHACPNIIAALLTCPPPNLTQSLATLTHPRTELPQPRLDSGSSSTENYPLFFEGPLFNGLDTWHASRSIMVSPLLFAVEGNASEQLTDILLDVGYKADGFTLRAAILRQLPLNFIQKILDSCDDVDAKCAIDVALYHHIAQGDADQTPLCAAIRLGRVDIVKTMLAHHANINAIRGVERITALGEAIWFETLPIADLLLDAGAEVNDSGRSVANGFVSTVLQYAAEKGFVGLVQRLIARGADLNARRNQYTGHTALEAAAENGRLDTVYLLLEAGTDTEGYGRVQYLRAIALASESGHVAVAELLREYREWTTEDFTIWNQFYPAGTEKMVGSHHTLFLHPLELALGELVNQLAAGEFGTVHHKGFKYFLSYGCRTTLPRKCDKLVARLVKDRVEEVSNADASGDTNPALLEEAAQFAIQAIRMWAEESGPPLQCWSIWNTEYGAARRSVEICNVCGSAVWYYFPCSLQARTEEVADMVAQSLQQWLPSSWLEERSRDDSGMLEDLAIRPPFGTDAFQGATRDKPVWGITEQDDVTLEHDAVKDNVSDSYHTRMPSRCDDGFPDKGEKDDWEAQWAIILAEMGEDKELNFTPMDCEW
jgi:ankyrin repeat protein